MIAACAGSVHSDPLAHGTVPGAPPGTASGTVAPSDSGPPDAASGSTGSPPSAGDGGADAREYREPYLGSPCATDAHCGSLTCIDAGEGTPFPAGGICSRRCEKDADCADVEAGARCIDIGGRRYCASGCSPTYPKETAKPCRRSADAACAPAVGGGVCRPVCTRDDQCAGSYCNPQTGLCDSARPAALPLGSACTQDSDCRGYCLTNAKVPTWRLCSAPCVIGGYCGVHPAGGPEGQCMNGPWLEQPWKQEWVGAGDLGACYQLCDSTGDCLDPCSTCMLWTAQGSDPGISGRGGYCDLDRKKCPVK